MRNKWYVPVAVFGLGSLGLLVLTERGREVVNWVAEQFEQTPNRILELNDSVQRELDRIQLSLDQVAESLNLA